MGARGEPTARRRLCEVNGLGLLLAHLCPRTHVARHFASLSVSGVRSAAEDQSCALTFWMVNAEEEQPPFYIRFGWYPPVCWSRGSTSSLAAVSRAVSSLGRSSGSSYRLCR